MRECEPQSPIHTRAEALEQSGLLLIRMSTLEKIHEVRFDLILFSFFLGRYRTDIQCQHRVWKPNNLVYQAVLVKTTPTETKRFSRPKNIGMETDEDILARPRLDVAKKIKLQDLNGL